MSKTQNDVSYQKIGLQMCCYVHMEECSSGLKSYKWKKKKKTQQQKKMQNQTKTPNKTKTKPPSPKLLTRWQLPMHLCL